MATTGDNLGIAISETPGVTPWYAAFETGWGKLDAVVHLDVIQRNLNTPPGSPSNGDRYHTGAAPTGAWAGQANKIAVRRAAAWVFYSLREGWLLTSQADPRTLYKYESSALVQVGGADFKDSVRVATTANGTLATAYENGDTVDGVALATGDRILLKNQTSGSENGIYTVAASGAPTRAKDFDEDAEVTAGVVIPVEAGTANGDSLFILTTNNPITVGSTSLSFSAFGPSSGITALTGDVTASGSGSVTATIANNAVTLAKMATMSTANFLGRTTGGTGNVESLTATQATALLNAVVGDSGSGGTKGLVPAPASGDAAAGKFLKADGTFAVPSGGGGSGTVNSGTQYQVAYYPSTAAAVSGLGNLTTDASGVLSHATTARTTGNPTFYHRIVTPADTSLTAATESVGIQFGGNTSAATVTRQFTGGGTFTLQRENLFVGPTYGATSSTTISDATTVTATPPTAGTNMTLTRSTTFHAKVSNTAHQGYWAEMPSGANGDAFFNTVAGTKVFRVAQQGGETNVVTRANGDVSTSATDGFLYLSQFSAFTKPTGTPTTYAGAPVVIGKDATFGWHGLWGYVNGGWVDFSGIFTRNTSSTGTGAQTIDWGVWGAHVTRTFTFGAGNAVFTFTAPAVAGSLLTFMVVQDGTGSRTATWPASVKWPGATAPTLSTGSGKRDVFQFTYDGTNYYSVTQSLDVR